MKTKTILFVCAILTVTACAQVIERPETEICNFIIRAGHEENHSSKTMVHNGGTQVLWEPADEIKVFFKGAGDKFISQNTDVEPVADFSGSLEIPLGTSQSGSDILWGLYPFATDATSDGESVTTILPVQQTGRAGSFAKDTHITLARSETRNLTFYNVTGGLRFSITEDGIKSVTIQGNNNESLAGQIKVGFDNGVPVIQEVTDGKPILTLTAPDGGTFQKGQWYYFEAIPGTLSGGFKMVFHKEDKIAERITEKQISFKRGIYVSIEKADEGLLFKYPVPEAVDLGLSVKWASFNVGAVKPEDYGDYFAWGETEPKDDYSWSTYKWSNGSATSLTKYVYDSDYGIVDNKTALDLEDDAAYAYYSDGWRMPTESEYLELRSYCTWEWTTENGVNGYRITSKKQGYTDNSIFIPAGGSRDGTGCYNVGSTGFYWLPELSSYQCIPDFIGLSEGYYSYYYSGSNNRYQGFPVRPVYGEFIPVNDISMPESIVILVGSRIHLNAVCLPSNATYKSVSCKSSDTSIASCFGGIDLIDGVAPGKAVITVIAHNGICKECEVTVIEEEPCTGIEMVDLGLSVKWASCNVGATRYDEYGDYFAWGETSPKGDYSWMTYKWYDSAATKTDKYNAVDNKTLLDLEDDAANANWGGEWRMPTIDEWEELLNPDNCNRFSGWLPNGNGVLLFISKKPGFTDKHIYLPKAGYYRGTSFINENDAYYWSSSRSISQYDYNYAYCFCSWQNSARYERYNGFPIRPVSSSNGILGVSLDKSDLRLYVGNKRTLTAIVSPATATDKSVVWSTSNPSVATVSSSGVVSAVGLGSCTITVTTNDGGLCASCSVNVIEAPQAVDLGLGIKWAACNLGAIVPEEAGDYYAWGETEPKSDYSWTTYQWCNGSKTTLTKYNSDNSVGEIDNKTILDLGDDAANALLGGTWRLPTYDDFLLLNNRSYCDWQWTDSYNDTGVMGYIITSKISGYTDKSIFLPVTGYLAPNYKSPSYGFYWSSSLATDNSNKARSFSLWSNSHGFGSFERIRGFAIRPVTE